LAPIKILTYIGYLAYQAARKGLDILAKEKIYFNEADYDTLPMTVYESIFNAAGHFSAAAGYLATRPSPKYKTGPREGKLKSIGELEDGMLELFLSLGLILGMPVSVVERYKREMKAQLERGKKPRSIKRRKAGD